MDQRIRKRRGKLRELVQRLFGRVACATMLLAALVVILSGCADQPRIAEYTCFSGTRLNMDPESERVLQIGDSHVFVLHEGLGRGRYSNKDASGEMLYLQWPSGVNLAPGASALITPISVGLYYYRDEALGTGKCYQCSDHTSPVEIQVIDVTPREIVARLIGEVVFRPNLWRRNEAGAKVRLMALGYRMRRFSRKYHFLRKRLEG